MPDFIPHHTTTMEWVALALYLCVFVRTIPVFIKANGTRPSIVFAMFVTALTGSSIVHDLYGNDANLWIPVTGIVFAWSVLVYVEWAARYHIRGEK